MFESKRQNSESNTQTFLSRLPNRDPLQHFLIPSEHTNDFIEEVTTHLLLFLFVFARLSTGHFRVLPSLYLRNDSGVCVLRHFENR